MRSLLLAFQKWLATNKTTLKAWALMTEVACVVLLAFSIIAFMQPEPPRTFLREWSSRFGYLSLMAYLLTLTPGILRRFQVLSTVSMILMTFRRTLGVLMFLLLILHVSLNTVLPTLILSRPLTVSAPKIYGTIALLLLFPLWLTSNDYSFKHLGRKWKWIQRLTYIALLLTFAHLTYFQPIWYIPTFIFVILEILSWLLVWYRHRHQAAADVKIAG